MTCEGLSENAKATLSQASVSFAAGHDITAWVDCRPSIMGWLIHCATATIYCSIEVRSKGNCEADGARESVTRSLQCQ